jgi:multisubunit Na+/H+ antiporter MnhC subunit
MILLCALAVAVLVGIGLYGMLSPRPLHVGIGFIVLSNGINLGIMTASGSIPLESQAPLIQAGVSDVVYVDPLPQAFVLTAIVIGFAALAFVLGIVLRLRIQESREDAHAKQP